ncbi:pre-mRNA-splicing factor ATP-dependent RNA helicase PRP16-like [Cotesia typhae]|uniref:pre-mRNA-splicing factor ATP-dependent RNA helicase PRP16-like n=1 Tax=Cotesia typhae TaxID=2053667 RepID=UPI003D6984A9
MEEHEGSSSESTERITIIEKSFVISSNNNYLPQKTLTKPFPKGPFCIRLNNTITDDLDCKLRKVDEKMEELSLIPVFRRMICLAIKFDCVAEVLSIVSMETELTILYRMAHRGKELDTVLTQFRVVESDHLSLLNCYKAWEASTFNKIWCKRNGLDFTIMQQVLIFRQQLEQALIEQDVKISSCGIKWLSLLKCISQTYINKLAKIVNKISGEYASCQAGNSRFIHPSSAVNYLGFKPAYLVYHQLVATERALFMRGVTIIDAEWCPNPENIFSKSKISANINNVSVM